MEIARTAGKFDDVVFETIVKSFLTELESLSPRRIITKPPILPELAGPRKFVGFKLTNEQDQLIKGSPLYRTEGDAVAAAAELKLATGANAIGYREVPDYLDMSWREMLGEAYDNWRRAKWLNFQDEIMDHPVYAQIVAEGIEVRNRLVGPRGHTIGLDEFDPFMDGPLSWDTYMKELEGNFAVPLDTGQLPPTNLVPNASVQDLAKHSGAWLQQVKEGKVLSPLTLPTVTIGEKEVPILMVTPGRGYRLVPLKEYEGQARKWVSGHVSCGSGGQGKKGPGENFCDDSRYPFLQPR
jgi:hypothetical protein